MPAMASVPGKWTDPIWKLPPPPRSLERLRGTVASALHFGGRSGRSELVNYVLCVAFIHLAVGLLLMLGLSYPAYAIAQDVLQVLYFIPVPALLARRLHDQNRPAALLWLAVPGVLLWVARKAFAFAQSSALVAELDRWTWPLDLAAAFASLALIIVLALPGTPGPNRFGPDPHTA